VLDIGCNEGFLDMEIAMRYFPKQMYAIDIDHRLVKNARKTLVSMVKKDKNYHDLVMNEKG
jgi:tRNA1(Val) A37 N6-methylase TrmN6